VCIIIVCSRRNKYTRPTTTTAYSFTSHFNTPLSSVLPLHLTENQDNITICFTISQARLDWVRFIK